MGIALFFQFSFVWQCFKNHNYEVLWLLKKYKLYTLCTLILSNPLHLAIASELILIKSN
jgi:hypothetical protein